MGFFKLLFCFFSNLFFLTLVETLDIPLVKKFDFLKLEDIHQLSVTEYNEFCKNSYKKKDKHYYDNFKSSTSRRNFKRSVSSNIKLHNVYGSECTRNLHLYTLDRHFLLHMVLDSDTITPNTEFILVTDNSSLKFQWPEVVQNYYAFVEGESKERKSHVMMDEDSMMATLYTRDDVYFIEPISTYSANESSNLMVTYKLSDFKNQSEARRFCEEINLYPTSIYPHHGNSYTEKSPPSLKSSLFLSSFLQSTFKKSKKNKKINRNKRFYEFKNHKVCGLALIGDVNFFIHQCRSKVSYCFKSLVSLLSRLNTIYLTLSINNVTGYRFQVKHAKLYKNNQGPESFNLLNNDFIATTQLDKFSRVLDWGKYCLAHLFTHTETDSVVGLAYRGTLYGSSGICSPCAYNKCLNTGLTNTFAIGSFLSTSQIDIVTAHEIGHNFGSGHDPEECVKPKELGGNYIMFDRSVSGRDKNNRIFSNCTNRQVDFLFSKGINHCFTEKYESFCGNGIQEEDEECDEGKFEFSKLGCCQSNCRLQKNSQCSPYNSFCCDHDCKFSNNNTRCSLNPRNSCISNSYCTGTSPNCPNLKPKPFGHPCNNLGQCYKGFCLSYCSLKKFNPCFCLSEENQCLLCCIIGGVCQPIIVENTSKPHPLEDFSECYKGLCFKKVCLEEKGHQMMSIPLSSFEFSYNLSFFDHFVENNLALFVFFLLLIPFIFIMIFFCYQDKKKYMTNMDLSQWYSYENEDFIWKKSQRYVLNYKKFYKSYNFIWPSLPAEHPDYLVE